MASEITDFLREKWRQSFLFFDLNKDGVITVEDYVLMADNLSKVTNASEEEATKTRAEYVKWFGYLQPQPSIVVDEKRYLETCEEVFQNRQEHVRETRNTAVEMFNRIDLNKNGVISLVEFEIFFQSYGPKDKQRIVESFHKIDKDGDGYIQREEFIEDFVRFFTDPDPVSGRAFLFPMC